MTINGNILAIDTTFAACSAAVSLRREGCAESISAQCEAMTTGHAERLMPMIGAVMREADIGFAQLDSIAVTVGPGTFTGTRVGVAAARGLAMATGLTTLATTSLAVIAAMAKHRLGDAPDDAVLTVCVDARRDQVYRQEFELQSAVPLTPATIMSTADAAAHVSASGRTIVVGSAAQAVAECATNQGRDVEPGPVVTAPSAAYVFKTELERHDRLRPLYLRAPDAKPQTNNIIARCSQTE